MSIVADSQLLEPGKVVTLYELDATAIGAEAYRFHSHLEEGPITFQGKVYDPWPIEATGFAMNGNGRSVTPSLTIANVNGAITALVLFFDDLLGATLIRRRTLAKYLDGQPEADPNEQFPQEIWIVNQRKGMDNKSVSFELISALDFRKQQLPGRQVIANLCPWRYRSTECGYTGGPVATRDDIITTDASQDDCSNLVRGCKFRFGEDGELSHGGFPAAGLIR